MSLLRVQRQHSDETWKQTHQILSGVFTEEIMEKMTFSSRLWSRQARRTKPNGGKCTGWSGLNIQIQAQRNQDGLSDTRLTDWKESHWRDEPCHLAGGLSGCEGDSLPIRALTGSQSMQAGGSRLYTRQSGRPSTAHKASPGTFQMLIKCHLFLLCGHWTFNLLKSDIYWPSRYRPRTQPGALHYLFKHWVDTMISILQIRKQILKG